MFPWLHSKHELSIIHSYILSYQPPRQKKSRPTLSLLISTIAQNTYPAHLFYDRKKKLSITLSTTATAFHRATAGFPFHLLIYVGYKLSLILFGSAPCTTTKKKTMLRCVNNRRRYQTRFIDFLSERARGGSVDLELARGELVGQGSFGLYRILLGCCTEYDNIIVHLTIDRRRKHSPSVLMIRGLSDWSGFRQWKGTCSKEFGGYTYVCL